MKNLCQLLFCFLVLTCSSDEDSGNSPAINLPASISTDQNSISFENTMISQASESKVIVISAENIDSEISILVPEGYEASFDNTSFSNLITFQPEISNELYIRFIPTEAINYYSTLQISSDEINNDINVNLFGIGTALTYSYQAFQNQALGYGGGFYDRTLPGSAW